MPVQGDRYTFSQENVNKSPSSPGVYALYDGNMLIYYGSSALSIRDRLQRHLDGKQGSRTQEATTYRREVCSNGLARERQLLEAYKQQYRALPRCNDVIP